MSGFDFRHALPAEFLARMNKQLGDEFVDFLASYELPPKRGLRANDIYNPPKSLILQGISGISNAFLLGSEQKLGNTSAHHAGGFYLQEPSAMLPAWAVEIECESPLILDLCAAPGGKTTQLADRFPNGKVVANEYVRERAQILLGNVERLGLQNVAVTNLAPEAVAAHFPQTFDLVLVDAPCSGDGMFRREPDAISQWSPNVPTMCAERQKNILSSALKCLKPDGKLVYSTCTFSREENENIAVWLAERGVEQIPVSPAVAAHTRATADRYSRIVYPHDSFGEGQFIAVFRAVNLNYERVNPTNSLKYQRPSERINSIWNNFSNETFGSRDINPMLHNSNLVLPTGVNLPQSGVLRDGILLGEIREGREILFVPHHQLFKTLHGKFLTPHRIDLSDRDPRVEKYLRGEEISVENNASSSGWAVVTFERMPLGGAKVSNGVAKNHYPKGLRNS